MKPASVIASMLLLAAGAECALAQRCLVLRDSATAPGVMRRGGGGPPWARSSGAPPWARGGAGRGFAALDPQFEADREVFHSLLDNHQQIRRSVVKRADGVATVTESDDPQIAAAIQAHAAAMHDRLKKALPIHLRDPLFAAVFANAGKIKMAITKSDKGVRAVATSDDPYVVKLIQAHAEVVNLFASSGFAEARKNHSVPDRTTPAPQ